MADQVTIYNLALDRIGTSTIVQATDENTAEASACTRYWSASIDETLAGHDWRFATAVVALALTGTAPPHWLYQYALPSDSVKLRGLLNPIYYVSSVAIPTQYPWAVPQLPPAAGAPPIPFEVASGADGSGNQAAVIWSNLADAYCLYTRRITTTALWDAGFTAAIAWRLAYNIAMPITSKPEVQAACLNGFNEALAYARNQTANEQVIIDTHTPDWIQTRHGYQSGDGAPLLTDLSTVS